MFFSSLYLVTPFISLHLFSVRLHFFCLFYITSHTITSRFPPKRLQQLVGLPSPSSHLSNHDFHITPALHSLFSTIPVSQYSRVSSSSLRIPNTHFSTHISRRSSQSSVKAGNKLQPWQLLQAANLYKQVS
ncbi:hypothetical protein P153DRAFT_136976 [Dothidotthia symphoricarpi CBS 119687]|uniref:Uncharacterized protein n=1 Tax=Dothidotthia symphoricarpi CBS 119687 TaxID=1392245 RepID=A0A6A5ZYU7_9PLEO|nr:uncharacterized protein P153DRAFT_136976 [Dothidotthia symphoricarpi CBS 119687]KAF2124195.1 hypothetical protein P153DRAFT_136976 [Dothidotthia symphoricarpi CBS 119687]